MTRAHLSLTGIRASGRHGASPGERDRPQEFVVDLELVVDVGEDELQATADYRTVVDVARATIEQESSVLLESLAAAVAEAVARIEHVVRVTAVVHKPGAARSLGIADVSAQATVE